jgi:hypothetical protein
MKASFYLQGIKMATFPGRSGDALGGNQFIQSIAPGDNAKRDDLIIQELLKGNIPNFLRQLVSVTVTEKNNTLIYNVMPDYLALGSDTDYIRVPLSAPSAQKVADSFGCTLPTAKMSNQVWQAAAAKLPPKPMSGRTSTIGGKTYSPQDFLKSKMTDTDSFAEHNRLIQEQLAEHKPGELVAGHKKDVVISNQLASRPDKVAIHGLHNTKGQAIQGGFWGHDINYRDYSHGIRLIDRKATLNGKPIDLVKDILQNQEFAYLVSDEGALKFTSYSYKKDKDSPVAPPQDSAVATKTEPGQEYTPDKPKGGREQFLGRIDDFLSQFKT